MKAKKSKIVQAPTKAYQKPEIKSTLPAKEIRDIEQPCAFNFPEDIRPNLEPAR